MSHDHPIHVFINKRKFELEPCPDRREPKSTPRASAAGRHLLPAAARGRCPFWTCFTERDQRRHLEAEARSLERRLAAG